eukprot:7039014-Prymnesium_polylepis.2
MLHQFRLHFRLLELAHTSCGFSESRKHLARVCVGHIGAGGAPTDSAHFPQGETLFCQIRPTLRNEEQRSTWSAVCIAASWTVAIMSPRGEGNARNRKLGRRNSVRLAFARACLAAAAWLRTPSTRCAKIYVFASGELVRSQPSGGGAG